jgi:lysophospholipase L1-like esterase
MQPKQDKRELLTTMIAVGLAGVTVLTCSAIGPRRRPAHPGAPEGSATRLGVVAAAASKPEQVAEAAQPLPYPTTRLWQDPGSLGTSPEGMPLPRLARFYEALAQLQHGVRRDHVRILWIGDSHTQADVWTDALRKHLQKKFGNGGPGFVHVGWDTYGYRHEDVAIEVTGAWSIRPLTLVSVTQVDDGVFGLGGVRLVPRGADACATVRVRPSGLPGAGTWDLAVRFVQRDAAIAATVDGQPPTRLQPIPSTLGHIVHVKLTTAGPGGELRVDGARGAPQLLGVVIEASDRRGVVVDTLGLNGARYSSTLAWDEASWTAEVARRRPDLVVTAFGTNESSDLKLNPARHAERVRALVHRALAAAPGTDCLIFGPVDRGGLEYADVVAVINDAQRSAAESLGCGYWNGQHAMGGKGSWSRWMAMDPPLAASNGVHLYPRGYRRLGEMLARDMLAAYSLGAADPAAAPDEAVAGARGAASPVGSGDVAR